MSEAREGLRLSLVALVVVCLAGCGGSEDDAPGAAVTEIPLAYAGTDSCAECHPRETRLWRGSHHDLAMQEASAETVLGDFDDQAFDHFGQSFRFFRRDGEFVVHTAGADGEPADFEVAYTFGVEPLQQYLIELAGGRLQALGVAWDTRPREEGGQRWFHLYPDEAIPPDDELHWTGRNQTWNFMCARCHSTDLRKNFVLGERRYETTWSEIDVGCEACHGPASRHLEWARRAAGAPQTTSRSSSSHGFERSLRDRDGAEWRLDPSTGVASRSVARTDHAEIETCAPCHSRRSEIDAAPRPGEPFLDGYRPALLEQGLYHPDGQILEEVYVWGSFLQSRMYLAGVTCRDCHDPHSLDLHGEGDAVCAACHPAEELDTREHHFHEPGSAGASCVECHMPETTYMVVDPRRDHAFRVPRPDLTVELGVPNACNRCHAGRSSEWAVEAMDHWYGGSDREPHFARDLAAARRGEPGADARLLTLAADAELAPIVRASGLALLRNPSSPEARAVLRPSIDSPHPLVRLGALRALDAADLETRIELAGPLLDDPHRAIRIEAARLLAPIDPRQVDTDLQRRLASGLAELESALEVSSDRPETHLVLGIVRGERGDLAGAEASYRTALALDPRFVPSFVNLADLYRAQDRDAEGERLLREAAELAPDDADVQHSLGLLLVRQQRLEEAIGALTRAADLRPESPRYAYVLAAALQAAGNVDQAIERLETAIEDHPDDPELLVALVAYLSQRGQRQRALGHARRLQALYPEDPAVASLIERLDG